MYISKFRVKNYKSFLDSGEMTFTPGINIITGQNNAGKTALMQTLSLSFKDVPHRSSNTIPDESVNNIDPSIADIELIVSNIEIENYIFNQNQIFIPLNNYFPNQGSASDRSFFDKLESENMLVSTFQAGTNPILSHIKAIGQRNQDVLSIYNVLKKEKLLKYNSVSSGSSDGFYLSLAQYFARTIYLFKAERMNIGVHAFQGKSELENNASNLPDVLNVMQGNFERFTRFNKYVNKIFPNVHRISVRPQGIGSNLVEIVVWNENPELERDDLVVPLSECGTGLSQVLAILYVVLTANVSKIILIDEPNSFLHPGASRKLIEILKEYPQHQFIITTHSPTIIAAANPKTIHIVKNENAQSTVTSLDINEAKGEQSYLTEIGAKLSDVFGADNILWVEGKTEEICFPKIIEKMKDVSQMGTAILGVKHTGDFEGKHAQSTFDIYNKLSTGKGLIPPAVGFIFDKEGKNETVIGDLKRQSDNKIVFSERKMFENYIINPNAIFEVINQDLKEEISLETIKGWIENNKWDKKFITQKQANNKNEADWLLHVDGAKFLAELFNVLSDTKVTYSKVKHSVALAEWLIENDFENSFDDYKIIFEKFLDKI
ncbi:MAG: AAA family ATPase [Bacteroidota bacterium]